MKLQTIMVVAGEASGDSNAAALVKELAAALPGARFIGAGGPKMAEAGVTLSFDLASQAVIGVSAAIRKLPRFLRYRSELVRLAANEKPEIIILVDFEYFNRQLARGIRATAVPGWRPLIVKYVSPQVWASRPGRAEKMVGDFDLLLCLFPFEKEWYAQRLPQLRVECVGHPMFDNGSAGASELESANPIPTVLLLPGSRRGELQRHLPVMMPAAELIAARKSARFKLISPNEAMAGLARDALTAGAARIEIQTGHLDESLAKATVAIASTGTVTLECARFGVPVVAIYKTSLLTYLIGRQIITVKYLAMPNIIAGEALYPEFIQGRATPRNIAGAALELLADPARRAEIRSKLRKVVSTLGGPGAAARAAAAILKLADSPNPP
jgi:lipid-A-disaccharide synthase